MNSSSDIAPIICPRAAEIQQTKTVTSNCEPRNNETLVTIAGQSHQLTLSMLYCSPRANTENALHAVLGAAHIHTHTHSDTI